MSFIKNSFSSGFRRGGRTRGNFRTNRSDNDSCYGSLESVTFLGSYVYPCQNEFICKVSIEDVPFFNAPIYLENGQCIGKIDEVFGSVKDFYVSIKSAENVTVTSFQKGEKLFIESYKLIPLKRFLCKERFTHTRNKGKKGFGPISRGGGFVSNLGMFSSKRGGFSGRNGGFAGGQRGFGGWKGKRVSYNN